MIFCLRITGCTGKYWEMHLPAYLSQGQTVTNRETISARQVSAAGGKREIGSASELDLLLTASMMQGIASF